MGKSPEAENLDPGALPDAQPHSGCLEGILKEFGISSTHNQSLENQKRSGEEPQGHEDTTTNKWLAVADTDEGC